VNESPQSIEEQSADVDYEDITNSDIIEEDQYSAANLATLYSDEDYEDATESNIQEEENTVIPDLTTSQNKHAWFNGPALPYRIQRHSMVKIGEDLVALGGSNQVNDYHKSNDVSKSLFRLSCSSEVCTWTELGQKLKRKRSNAVAFPLLTSMVACKGEEKEEEGEGEQEEENQLAEPFSNTFEIMDEIATKFLLINGIPLNR